MSFPLHPALAQANYKQAIEQARNHNDGLWLASSLEGLSAAMIATTNGPENVDMIIAQSADTFKLYRKRRLIELEVRTNEIERIAPEEGFDMLRTDSSIAVQVYVVLLWICLPLRTVSFSLALFFLDHTLPLYRTLEHLLLPLSPE